MKKYGSIVKNMKKQKKSNIAITTIWLFLLIAIWEGAVSIFHIEPWILPKPSAIVHELIDMKDLLLPNTVQTLQEVLIGLFFAIILGTSIAIIMDVIPLFRVLINPLLVISQTVPIVVLAPLFIIWFGYGMLPKVMVVILVCFFPVTLSILEGFQTVDQSMLKLLQTMRASKWQVYQKVKFPAVLPYFFSGLKIAVTYSVMGAIIGEWLGASEGLGVMLTRATKSFLTARVFGIAAVIVCVTLLLYFIVEFMARLTAPWVYRKDGRK
ncbi:ABC-type nitrate/sulfonate/bicarbonate transport system, permease component [Bacillus sp. 491mf]|uniref:ABC transporter permease n=1 Tax=Bacillus TaxID=1386 RepID=UPI0005591FFB|nr:MULTISPECIES: ABC transporter permease [unclassified Bacillus (in: firmicutes)]SFD16884.1 ABC-type nitrate/sulfonate/bicarbonate transport system, permease component [Bacillus sp. 491mf]